ncbi:DUF47 domain-containing protein [Balneatrix alpica]|uniref:DUF47 domain-containing protein n=1 Tax=Balneatrix alpica TaxID=75684 RepID=A0ABV5ZCK1_9GAMM|nr:DUF47 family protein [Balneatrix alpica]
MATRFTSLFTRGKKIERKIDDFFDKIILSGLIYQQALQIYLESGPDHPSYAEKMQQVEKLESKGDQLRRDVETELYVKTLIPDLRGDVLNLLEDMDGLSNLFQSALFRLHSERPTFPANCHEDLHTLVQVVCRCAEEVVQAARAYFRQISKVRERCLEVQRLETEADKLSTRLLTAVFDSERDLAEKIQLRYFIERIDAIANNAEDISDRLSIYAIKRRI